MEKDKLIYNGNEKQVYATENPCQVIFRYKDVTTAYHGVKRARFAEKGTLNNRISALLLGYLNDNGVETHFVEVLGEREQLCRKIEMKQVGRIQAGQCNMDQSASINELLNNYVHIVTSCSKIAFAMVDIRSVNLRRFSGDNPRAEIRNSQTVAALAEYRKKYSIDGEQSA